MTEPDMVNKPPHYQSPLGVEAVDVIEALGMSYHIGNALKYLWRAGKKDPAKEIQDLEKSVWFINRRIKFLKEQK